MVDISLSEQEIQALKQLINNNSNLVNTGGKRVTKIYPDNLIVLQNRLLNAISDLSLNERRLIMFLSPLVRKAVDINPHQLTFIVKVKDFQNEYGIKGNAYYAQLRDITKSLQRKSYNFWDFDENTKLENEVDISWITKSIYKHGQGEIHIDLHSDLVEMLTVFDKANPFTKYERQMITSLGGYGIILFELIASCMHQQHKQKSYTIEYLREKFNCVDKYNVISEFKRNVLDTAISDIHQHTPYRITYNQVKKGRKVTDIVFSFENTAIKATANQVQRDENNLDLFSIENLSDKQLERIARNKLFIADYNHLISPQSNTNNDMNEWVKVMVSKMKTDIKQFSKKPLNDYLK